MSFLVNASHILYLSLPDVAVPDGEAHRHEPPIPHDEVQIEKRKNQQELDEDKNKVVGNEEDELAEHGAGQQLEVTQSKVRNEAMHKNQDVEKIHVAEDIANEVHEKMLEQKQPELVVVEHKSVEQLSLVKEQEAENRLAIDKKSEESDKKAVESESMKRE